MNTALLVGGGILAWLLLRPKKAAVIPTVKATPAPPKEFKFESWMFTYEDVPATTRPAGGTEGMVRFVSHRPDEELAAYAAALQAAGIPHAIAESALWVDSTRVPEAGAVIRAAEAGLRTGA